MRDLQQLAAMSSKACATAHSIAADAASAPAISSAVVAEQNTARINANQLQGSSHLASGQLCSSNLSGHSAAERPAPSSAYARLQTASIVSHSASCLPSFALPNSSSPCTSCTFEDNDTPAAAAVLVPASAAAAATAYQSNGAMAITVPDSLATASAPGHAITDAAAATDVQEDVSVVINLVSPADACRTAGHSATNMQCTRSWSSKPASMQDSLAQHILRAHQAKQLAVAQLENDSLALDVMSLEDHQVQKEWQQQQQDIHVKPASCTRCCLKLFAARLNMLSPILNGSSCSTSSLQVQHAESSSSTTISCKACWQLQLQQVERHEMFLAAQLTASCKAEAQKHAMQAACYSAYAFAVPDPSVALCADRYTTWAAFIEQLAQDRSKYELCYLQYRQAYVCLLAQLVAKQGGRLQPYSPLWRLCQKVKGCLATAFGPVQQCATTVKQHLCWDFVEQLPMTVTFHVIQLLLLLIQCIYVPLTVVLVPFMWVGREVKMTVEYTAEWLWDVYKAAVKSLVYLFAKGFNICFE